MKPNLVCALTGLASLIISPAHAGTEAGSNNGSFLAGPAADSWLKASLNVGYETLHVYRGADSSFGDPIIWETLDLDAFNLVHFNLYNGNAFNGEYGELTPSGYFYKDLGPVTVAAGMIWYHFPDYNGSDSEEYFVNFSGDLGAGFSASAWFSYNAESEGWYHELKVSHSMELCQRVKLESYGALGYSEHYRSGGDGLDNLTFAVGLPVTLAEGLTLKPSLGYAFALETMDSENEGWAGLTLSYQF
jgi:hypothetical protein